MHKKTSHSAVFRNALQPAPWRDKIKRGLVGSSVRGLKLGRDDITYINCYIYHVTD